MQRTLGVVVALCLVLLAGASYEASGKAATEPGALGWKVEQSPFHLVFTERGRPLLEHRRGGTPGPGARLSYRTRESETFHTLTRVLGQSPVAGGTAYRVATTEPGRTATVTVQRTARGVGVDVELSKSPAAVDTIYESFAAVRGEHFLGGGERRDTVDLQGKAAPFKVWHPCGNLKPAPFVLSSRGYGIALDTTAVGQLALGQVLHEQECDWGTPLCGIAHLTLVIQVCAREARLRYEVLAGTLPQLLSKYSAKVGRPQRPSPAQFEVIKWRDEVRGEAELMEDVDRFRDAGIPLGWMLLDNPWQAGCAGPLTFDPGRWPDPRGTIRRLHERDVRFMLWVSPTVVTDCSPSLYPADAVYGGGRHKAIDLTRPDVRAAFEARLRSLFALGVDGVKGDRGDEVDFEREDTGGGPGTITHNLQPLLFAQSVVRTLREARGSDITTMFRSGFTGSPSAAPGFWVGDLTGSFGGLREAIRAAQTAGLAGYSTWGSDIGGYESRPLTAEVFVRWAQLGAVSPVFEVGGIGRNAKPWELGATAMQGLRAAALLHYELFPYLYELALDASRTGVPVLRPLAFHHPDDERSWAAELELSVGPALLAAPVAKAGTDARVYLPPGTWVDLHRGTTSSGGRTVRRHTPLLELPLYLRSGAAVPFDLRRVGIWSTPHAKALGSKGRGGWLVTNGGGSGSSTLYGSIRATRRPDGLALELRGAPRETAVVVAGAAVPGRITVGGRTLPRAGSPDALRGLREGWAVLRAPYRGTVVKLSPSAGSASVVVRR